MLQSSNHMEKEFEYVVSSCNCSMVVVDLSHKCRTWVIDHVPITLLDQYYVGSDVQKWPKIRKKGPTHFSVTFAANLEGDAKLSLQYCDMLYFTYVPLRRQSPLTRTRYNNLRLSAICSRPQDPRSPSTTTTSTTLPSPFFIYLGAVNSIDILLQKK